MEIESATTMRMKLAEVLGGRGSLERQYALATVLFAALVLAIIFLFGHMISQSLSRRYLEDVLLSGREEAHRIAEEFGSGGVFDVLEKRQEFLARNLQGVPQQRLWESVEVTDREGKVVYTHRFQVEQSLPESMATDLELVGGSFSEQNLSETENTYQISVPLGEVGEVVVNVSKGRLAERVVRLRSELLTQTITAAVITLVTLTAAFALVWFLIARTRRLEAQHREAEELAALGTLAANLAHEIRNPLNSINLNLELLDEDLAGGTDDARDSLQGTRKEVSRLARLVSDFLTYARPGDPCLEPVPVALLVRDVVEFLRVEARNMGVHLRSAPELADEVVMSDASQLRQVLLNLVLNAVQSVSDMAPERRVVEMDAEVENGHVSLIIRDRGDGIPVHELVRVRKAFYTRRRGGTGLGLAIADRFIEAHGGHIDLCNLEPTGFEARVVLPIHACDGNMAG